MLLQVGLVPAKHDDIAKTASESAPRESDRSEPSRCKCDQHGEHAINQRRVVSEMVDGPIEAGFVDFQCVALNADDLAVEYEIDLGLA